PDGVLTRTPGLFGGRPGGPVRGVMLNPAGEVVQDYGIGALVTLSSTDEILELRLAGGAGYGDPLDRPVDAVQRDLDGRYVTADGARLRRTVETDSSRRNHTKTRKRRRLSAASQPIRGSNQRAVKSHT